jgi:hypothetical protein
MILAASESGLVARLAPNARADFRRLLPRALARAKHLRGRQAPFCRDESCEETARFGVGRRTLDQPTGSFERVGV